jgi:hypothetical protein
MIHRLPLLLVLGLAAAGFAGEPAAVWRPHAHPAYEVRNILGFTVPAHELALASEVPGRLVAVGFDAGTVIPEGDDAARMAWRLDDGPAALAEAQAAAALAEAQAAVVQLRAEAAVAARERDFRAGELDRLRRGGDGIAARDLDATTFAAEAAELRTAAMAAAVARGEAGLATAQQALALAADRRARHTVAAPAGWTVTARLREPGALVMPGEPVLLLADLRELAVIVHLDDAELAALPAEGVALAVVRLPDRQVPARLHHAEVRIDPRSCKRRVELRLPGDAALGGGQEVRLAIRLPDPGGVLVPEDHLSIRMEQRYVHDVDGGSWPVTVLRRQDGQVVIAADALPAGIGLVPPGRERAP